MSKNTFKDWVNRNLYPLYDLMNVYMFKSGMILYKSSPSTPPAPDYVGAAKATAAGDLANLNAQTLANRPNQTTPWGSSTWSQAAPTQTFDQNGYDAAMATYTQKLAAQQAAQSSMGTPKNDWGQTTQPTMEPLLAPNKDNFTTKTDGQWSQNIQLTPAEQAALESQQAIQQKQSSLAQGLQGQVASTMADGFNSPQMNTYLNGVGKVGQNFNGFNNTSGTVDPNAPRFDQSTADAGTQAAYKAQMGLLQPQMEQDTKNLDAKLRLQGLTPGTEAYNAAYQNLSNAQIAQTNNIAANSVMTGNQMANQNYASALSGYNSGNAAQNQNFSQSLAGYGANQGAQQASNAAQNQAYTQGMNTYGTAYSSALQNYLQPLNSMNAVLSGQQVQNPTMPTFAQAGYTAGPNMSGAASALGQWNSGVAAQNNAANGQTMGLLGAGLGAIGNAGGLSSFFALSDARLKTNIKKIGVTEGGHNWYSWDWKDGHGSSTGVIAQEILQTVPSAVIKAANDFYMVDYGQLA